MPQPYLSVHRPFPSLQPRDTARVRPQALRPKNKFWPPSLKSSDRLRPIPEWEPFSLPADSSLLPSLPDAARVWIHPAASPLSEDIQHEVLPRLEAFIDEWSSHQQNVQGGATILHDRFVCLAGARIDGADPSGCAIDDATHAVDAVADAHGIEWVPSLHVIYRVYANTIAAVPRPTFQERADAGHVTTDTMVFDPSVTTLGAVRNGNFEQPAGQSWHADAFSLPTPA